ncbi:MAG TPA: cupin domain-containing protein [Vicinamibacterales bacterium]|nr:cupin domain-containing protein [Vicinamibacterales bacterium]
MPRHWHPNDERVTVLSGTLAVGMGQTWDDATMTDLTAGSYVVTSATMVHYALAKTLTTIQVSGMGPFVTNYVNPADAPSKR